jgi:hypothetical protein
MQEQPAAAPELADGVSTGYDVYDYEQEYDESDTDYDAEYTTESNWASDILVVESPSNGHLLSMAASLMHSVEEWPLVPDPLLELMANEAGYEALGGALTVPLHASAQFRYDDSCSDTDATSWTELHAKHNN